MVDDPQAHPIGTEPSDEPRRTAVRVRTSPAGIEPALFANHVLVRTDAFSPTTFIFFTQLIAPEAPLPNEPVPEYVEAPAHVVATVAMPTNRFRDLIDQLGMNYQEWFGEPPPWASNGEDV